MSLNTIFNHWSLCCSWAGTMIRVYPINRDFSGPAKRVQIMACRLIGNYPAKEYHHYWWHCLWIDPTSFYFTSDTTAIIEWRRSDMKVPNDVIKQVWAINNPRFDINQNCFWYSWKWENVQCAVRRCHTFEILGTLNNLVRSAMKS